MLPSTSSLWPRKPASPTVGYGRYQKHLTEMLSDSDSEEAEAYYKELIQNPSKSGVDLKSPVSPSPTKGQPGYLLRVDDKSKLEACVNKLRKLRNKDAAAQGRGTASSSISTRTPPSPKMSN